MVYSRDPPSSARSESSCAWVENPYRQIEPATISARLISRSMRRQRRGLDDDCRAVAIPATRASAGQSRPDRMSSAPLLANTRGGPSTVIEGSGRFVGEPPTGAMSPSSEDVADGVTLNLVNVPAPQAAKGHPRRYSIGQIRRRFRHRGQDYDPDAETGGKVCGSGRLCDLIDPESGGSHAVRAN
jgi:hypothetical protein